MGWLLQTAPTRRDFAQELHRQLRAMLPAMEPFGPGFFIFTDQPGNQQRVRVEWRDGELLAFFDDMQPGDEPVPVADMQGEWQAAFPSQLRG
jgi:hypothetical protein